MKKIFTYLIWGLAALIVIVALIVGVGYFYLHYQTKGHCERLTKIAKNPEVAKALATWVEHNVESRELKVPEVMPSNVARIPGDYVYNRQFDWSMLDIKNEHGRVLLMLPLGEAINSDAINVQAVSFSDRSRSSIVVALPGYRSEFMTKNSPDLTHVVDNIFVHCSW